MRFIYPKVLSRPISLSWGIVVGILFLGVWRIQSYVTNQDPSTIYLPLARRIVDTDFSRWAICQTSQWMAPGWPVMMAVWIKVLGPFSPAWASLFFGVAVLVAISRVAQRHVAGEGAAILPVVFVLFYWGMLSSIHAFEFLFYPFRELPAMAGMLWAVERAGSKSFWGPMVAAILCLCTAAVRETFFFPAGMGCLVSMLLAGDGREKRDRILCFVTPLLFAGVTASMLSMGINQQVRAVWANIRWGVFPIPLGEACVIFIKRISSEVTPLFLGLAAWAVYPRQTRRAALIFLSMALTLAAVHVVLPYHPRYVISTASLLPPIAGLALVPVWPRIPCKGQVGLSVVAFSLLLGFSLSHKPWGPEVTRADVHNVIRTVSTFLPAEKPFYVEPRSRSLAACLLGYSSQWPQGNPLLPEPGGIYFQIQQEGEREDRGSKAKGSPPVIEQLQSSGAILQPVVNHEGTPVCLNLRGVTFHLQRIVPAPSADAGD